jgi:hypothetical protein
VSIEELFSAPDWGALPDWLAAIGTISAVGVALGLAHRDGKRLDEERREAKAEREEAAKDRALFREQQAAEAEERKRRLASKVSVGVETYRDEMLQRHIIWTVHNGSDQSITMVSVVRRALPLEDGAEPPSPMICRTWTSIEAGGSREDDFQVRDENNMREGELQFTDGNGVRWQRMEFGSLRTVESGDPDALGMVVIQR